MRDAGVDVPSSATASTEEEIVPVKLTEKQLAWRFRHGMGKSTEYNSWIAMRRRCNDPHCDSYQSYGGSGVTVCERWDASFVDFLADMGMKPTREHTIDRIDSSGNYEPGNCRWATKIEQSRNTASVRLVTLSGKTLPISSWAQQLGLSVPTVFGRIRRGWSAERALTTPAASKHRGNNA
jgi:hypothetical protein